MSSENCSKPRNPTWLALPSCWMYVSLSLSLSRLLARSGFSLAAFHHYHQVWFFPLKKLKLLSAESMASCFGNVGDLWFMHNSYLTLLRESMAGQAEATSAVGDLTLREVRSHKACFSAVPFAHTARRTVCVCSICSSYKRTFTFHPERLRASSVCTSRTLTTTTMRWQSLVAASIRIRIFVRSSRYDASEREALPPSKKEIDFGDPR